MNSIRGTRVMFPKRSIAIMHIYKTNERPINVYS